LDLNGAKKIYAELKDKYPIFLTRDLNKAKRWLKEKARGTERIGIIASSGGYRLKPFGLCVQLGIDAKCWFLNSKEDAGTRLIYSFPWNVYVLLNANLGCLRTYC